MDSNTAAKHERKQADSAGPEWKQPQGFGLPEVLKAFAVAIVVSVPIVAIGGSVILSDYNEQKSAQLARIQQRAKVDQLLAAPPLEVIPASSVHRGRHLYATSCAACHSPSGTGVTGLGMDLVRSWFIASQDDAELKEFIRVGRAAGDPGNSTGLPMPPMGGHDLSEMDMSDLVGYMRVLQDPRRMPSASALAEAAAAAPPPAAAVQGNEDLARFLAAAGGDEELAEYIAHGAILFASSCAACHGRDGRGVAGMGTSLINSAFCDSLDDEEMLAFLKRGRDPGDPANTTGIGMPARGGNPALDDDDLLDIIAYIRAMEQLTASAK